MPWRGDTKSRKRFRKTMKRGGAVVLPKTGPSKGKDYRFKQINAYRIKPEPFPRVLYTRAKFGFEGLLTQTVAGVATGYEFRMNSIYDPLASLGGRTVVGHANLAALYNNYLVVGAKVNVSFNNPDTDGCRIGCRIRVNNQNSVVGNNMQDITEKPMTYMAGLNDSGTQTKTMSFFIRPWTLMGLSKLEYMANRVGYSSAMNNNPTQDRAKFDIFLINPQTAAANVRVAVKIVYYVQCFDRIGLVSSSI